MSVAKDMFEEERDSHNITKAKLKALQRKIESWHIDLSTQDIYILPKIEKEMADTVLSFSKSQDRIARR